MYMRSYMYRVLYIQAVVSWVLYVRLCMGTRELLGVVCSQHISSIVVIGGIGRGVSTAIPVHQLILVEAKRWVALIHMMACRRVTILVCDVRVVAAVCRPLIPIFIVGLIIVASMPGVITRRSHLLWLSLPGLWRVLVISVSTLLEPRLLVVGYVLSCRFYHRSPILVIRYVLVWSWGTWGEPVAVPPSITIIKINQQSITDKGTATCLF